jgi:hypothetical protein
MTKYHTTAKGSGQYDSFYAASAAEAAELHCRERGATDDTLVVVAADYSDDDGEEILVACRDVRVWAAVRLSGGNSSPPASRFSVTVDGSGSYDRLKASSPAAAAEKHCRRRKLGEEARVLVWPWRNDPDPDKQVFRVVTKVTRVWLAAPGSTG